MPRRKSTAKPREEDRDEGAPPLDRPDQVAIDANDQPEEISIFEGAGEDPPEKGTRQEPPDDPEEGLAPRVEPRDRRTRDAYEGSVLSSRSEDERRDRRGRDEDEEYSKKVQRRINREIALRKRTEARLAEERTARQQLEQRIQKLERQQTEEQSEASIRELEAKIRETAAKLAKAREDNDTAAAVALEVELSDLQGKKVLAEANRQAALAARSTERTPASPSARDDERGGDDPPNRGRSAEWIRAQRRWWNTSRWAGAKEDAIQHDTTILQEIDEGELDFEPYSEEHFAELARRLKHDYPDLEVRTLDGEVFEEYTDDDLDEDVRNERRDHMSRGDEYDEERRTARPARRAPMGGMGGRDGRRERNAVEMARRGKVLLTEDDYATMRIFKLDPNNPEHKKAFAKERARTLLRQANNGAARR